MVCRRVTARDEPPPSTLPCLVMSTNMVCADLSVLPDRCCLNACPFEVPERQFVFVIDTVYKRLVCVFVFCRCASRIAFHFLFRVSHESKNREVNRLNKKTSARVQAKASTSFQVQLWRIGRGRR
jgi:hypothetical protein